MILRTQKFFSHSFLDEKYHSQRGIVRVETQICEGRRVKVRPHYAAWQNATQQQKLLGIYRKINHNYISIYKNCGMRNTYVSYAAPKIVSHYSWLQILVRDTLPIKFLCRMAFCNMLQHAETMPKLRRIDIYTIFGICCVAKPHSVSFCHAA